MEDNNFQKITKFTDLIAWQEGHKLVLYQRFNILNGITEPINCFKGCRVYQKRKFQKNYRTNGYCS